MKSENNFSNKNLILLSILIFSIITVIFIIFNVLGKDGYNPSDDGVIIGQAYRILNGEIPHVDFISIRPVFSAVIHSISFNLPFPLSYSSRIITFIEYFIYSLLWIIILYKNFNVFNNKSFHLFSFSYLLIIAFSLNLNHYNSFPCTTIDAVMLSIVGFFFSLSVFSSNNNSKSILLPSVGFLFFSLASLTRQNFLILQFIVFLILLILFFQKKHLIKLLIICLIGAIPFLFYFLFLLPNSGIEKFINQITSRTELLETGLYHFVKSIIKSYVIIFNLGILISYLLLKYFYKDKLKAHFRSYIFNNVLVIIYILVNLILASISIISNNEFMFRNAMEIFWFYIISITISTYIFKFSTKQKAIIYFPIILAWTSSISLGDNSPVFVQGILISGGIFVLSNNFYLTTFKKILKPINIALLTLIIALLITSVHYNLKYNYRDNASSELEFNLGEKIKSLDNIYTNKMMYDYYSELVNIYDSLRCKDNFIVLPNNAGIYALLNSRNPFPLDWMQPDEYMGSENEIKKIVEDVISKKDLTILIDRFNVKKLYYEFEPLDRKKYFYISIIENNYQEIMQDKYKYFAIYKKSYQKTDSF